MHVLKFFLNTLLLIVIVTAGVFGFVHRKELGHEVATFSTKVVNRLKEVSGTQYMTAESVATPKQVAAKTAPEAAPSTVVVAPPPAPAPTPAAAAPQGTVSYPPDDYAPQPPPAPVAEVAPPPAAAPVEPEPQQPAPFYGQPQPPMPYQGYMPQMGQMGQMGQEPMAPPSQEEVPSADTAPPQMAATEPASQQRPAFSPEDGGRPSFAERQRGTRPGRPAEVSAEVRTAWIEARRAFWNQDIAKAEAAYVKLSTENAAEADLPGELGNLYLSQGRVDDASEQYLEAGRRLLKGSNRGRAGSVVNILSRLDHAKAEQLRQEMFEQQGRRKPQERRAY